MGHHPDYMPTNAAGGHGDTWGNEPLPVDGLEIAKFLVSLPEPDPLADITNMRRNLERALLIARDGSVYLTEAEVKYWIEGIDKFLQANPTRDRDNSNG